MQQLVVLDSRESAAEDESSENHSMQGTVSAGSSSQAKRTVVDLTVDASSSRKQQRITQFFDQPISREVLVRAYEEMTLAIITGNVPWNFLAIPHFQNYSRLLRPSVTLLQPVNASVPVLVSLHSKTSAGVHKFIRLAEFMTLATGSWTIALPIKTTPTGSLACKWADNQTTDC